MSRNDVALEVHDLGKQYSLGPLRPNGALGESLARAFRRPLRGGPPADAPRPAAGSAVRRDRIWALRDVGFEVKRGEVLGIIGANGAGKSTLLKILARITRPTTGWASIRGRVSSLLEVGTGFHPELSGRENIYLNGAILGMRRAETQRKFDEIVAFSEVERFIDTPIKHYSSGMYLRLAFAVAAHLEPEVLIVDEVLAVGDVAFQKKCIGKMGSVAGEGRTVLFVSHQMDSVQQLCPRTLLLDAGVLVADGDTPSVIGRYLARYAFQSSPHEPIDLTTRVREGSGEARFVSLEYHSPEPGVGHRPFSDGPLEILLTVESDAPRTVGSMAVFLSTPLGHKLLNADTVAQAKPIRLRQGTNHIRCRIESLHLNPGTYRLGLWLADPISSRANMPYDYIESAAELDVVQAPNGASELQPRAYVTCDFTFEED